MRVFIVEAGEVGFKTAQLLSREGHDVIVVEQTEDLGLGQVGAAESFGAVNAFGRTVLTLCMLLGRLEVIIALALLSPTFWRR